MKYYLYKEYIFFEECSSLPKNLKCLKEIKYKEKDQINGQDLYCSQFNNRVEHSSTKYLFYGIIFFYYFKNFKQFFILSLNY